MQQENDNDQYNFNSKGKKETIMYQINQSSQLIFKDALKPSLNKYCVINAPLKTSYVPRNHNFLFADFPKLYLPKKYSDYNVINIL